MTDESIKIEEKNDIKQKKENIGEEQSLIMALPPLKVESPTAGSWELLEGEESLLTIDSCEDGLHLYVKNLNSIISPIINNVELGFNYEDIPLLEEEAAQFSNIILSAGDRVLNIYLDYKDGYSLKDFNFSTNQFTIASELNTLEVALFNSLDELCRYNGRRFGFRPLPVRTYKVGLTADYSRPLSLEFARLREQLGQNDLFVLLKNWERKDRLLRANSNLSGGLESLVFKLGLNELDFILHYDNSQPLTGDGQEEAFYLKKRSGEPICYHERGYIDYLSPEGGKRLETIYKQIEKQKAGGIYLSPPFYRFETEDDYKKAICKKGDSYLTYHKSVNSLLERLNNIVAEHQRDNFAFFSPLLSQKLDNCIYIMESYGNFDRLVEQLDQYYLQGYRNIGLSLKNRMKENYLSPSFIKTLTLMLALPVYLLDSEIVSSIIKLDTLQIVKELIRRRLALRIALFNILKGNTPPFKPALVENKTAGFYIGNNIFISFLKEKIFEKFFYLPEGEWYCLTNCELTQGGGFFAYRGTPAHFLIFFRKGALIPYIEDKFYNRYLAPDKLKFYLFDGCPLTEEVEERSITRENDRATVHKISAKQEEESFTIGYSCDNPSSLGRLITFEVICGPKKLATATLNGSPIRVIKPKSSDSLEVSFKSTSDESRIKLTFQPQAQ